MPVISRSCLRCKHWHSTCQPTFVTVDGISQKSACRRCLERGIECVYPANPTKHWKSRTGCRIEEARKLFGGSNSARNQESKDIYQLPATSWEIRQGSFPDDSQSTLTFLEAPESGSSSRHPTVPKSNFKSKSQTDSTSKSQKESYSQDPSVDDGASTTTSSSEESTIVKRSRQDVSPTSTENEMRREWRQGALILDLIESTMRGIRVGLLTQWPGNRITSTASSSMANLINALNVNGFRPRGSNLGPLEQVNLALLSAIGCYISNHSEILGGDPSVTGSNPFPEGWFSNELLISYDCTGSLFCDEARYICFPNGVDLRGYGLRRLNVQRRLWDYCWRVFESHGILNEDDNRVVGIEEVQLLHHLYRIGYAAGSSSDDITKLRKLVLKRIKQIPISKECGWPTRQARSAFFDLFLAEEATLCLTTSEVSAITDEDIREFMVGTELPAEIFLTFDRKALPRIHDLSSHHRIVWATYMSIERMLAVTVHSVSALPEARAGRVMFRMLSLIQERQAWRETTISQPELLGGEAKVLFVTPFGPEDINFTLLDACSTMISYAALINLISNRVLSASPSTGPSASLEELRTTCLIETDFYIGKLLDLVAKGPRRPLWWYRRVLVAVTRLPGRLAFFGEYLTRAPTPEEFSRRSSHVSQLYKGLQQLSFIGSTTVMHLLDLEKGLRAAQQRLNLPGEPGL